MYRVYVLKSKVKDFHYVGMTDNLERRLRQHNAGNNKSRKAYLPFEIMYKEVAEDGKKARLREKFLKSGIGRKFIKDLSLSGFKR